MVLIKNQWKVISITYISWSYKVNLVVKLRENKEKEIMG